MGKYLKPFLTQKAEKSLKSETTTQNAEEKLPREDPANKDSELWTP